MSLADVFLIKEDIWHQHWSTEGRRYNVGALYDYAKAVTDPEEIPLSALQKQFDKTTVDEKKWSEEFIERCNNTNMQYPILVVRDRKDRLWIADGNHRYGKAVMQNLETILGYIVDESDLPDKALEPKEDDEDTGSHYAEG